MMHPRNVFTLFTCLFLPLYSLMCLKFVVEFQNHVDPLARALDLGTVVFGVLFMLLQVVMVRHVRKGDRPYTLRRLFPIGLAVWFTVEVVLGYWWCAVTGTDPVMEHTPFVVMFVGFNAAQAWALVRLGVFESGDGA